MLTMDDLEFALEYASGGSLLGAESHIRKDTGEIINYDEDGNFEALPDDIDDPAKYVQVPTKQELGLGKPLALEFAEQVVPERFDQVREIFRRKGAYGRYKDLLEREGKLEAWYEYEHSKTRVKLLEWCEENDIRIAT